MSDKTELTELRGIEFVAEINDEIIHCYVVHADRTIGVTIKNYDTDGYVACLNKAQLLRMLSCCSDRNRLYHKMFNHIIGVIEAGKGSLNICINPKEARCYQYDYSKEKNFKGQSCAWR
jgi:hypothetical protein